MNYDFFLDTISIHFRKVRRAKRLTLRLISPLQAKVTIPYFVSFRQAKQFVLDKADWIHKTNKKLSQTPKKVFADDQGLAVHQQNARIFIMDAIGKYAAMYNFRYKRIYVKNLKSRWGSCSSAKNLNFNYRLIFLPARLAEYIVVHELCHLREMNHGPCFWELVGQAFPDYKHIRKQLRGYSF